MPDWVKAMALYAFTQIDYSKIAPEITNTNLLNLKSHLEQR